MAALEDKIEYFRQLDRVRGIRATNDAEGDESDDSLDEEEAAFRSQCRRFHSKSDPVVATPAGTSSLQDQPVLSQSSHESPKPPAQNRPGGPPKRGVSAPLPATIKATPASEYRRRENVRNLKPSTSFVAETPLSVPDSVAPAKRKLLSRSETTPLPLKRSRLAASAREDSPSASVATKRRRRGAEQPKLAPEKDRVLSGLRFFYIPNDDVAPARRVKITKAMEYGACWTREIGEATHVVVDKHLVYADICGVLSAVPAESEPVIVNEDFPLDCIKYRRVLNPRQVKYEVSGYPSKTQDLTKPAPQKKGRETLPLKPPPVDVKRWDYLPNFGTPSQSSGASQLEHDIPEASEKPSQEAIVISDSQSPRVSQSESSHGQPGGQDGKPEPAPDAFGDELSGYIDMMQKYKALPLDDDHDEDLRSTSGTTTATSSDEDQRSASEDERRHTKPPKKEIAFEERFACYRGGTRDDPSTSPNARTIEILQEMCAYYTRMNDHWRTTGYRKAIKTLQRQTRQIRTADEARSLPNIGERLAQKIEEIVSTDRLRRLEYAQAEPLDGVLQLFLGVYDVGLAQANKWISQGFRTLEDLKERAKLSRNQKIGVERYEDLNTRIPRAEVEALGEIVRAAAAKIDDKVEVIIGGSYRRGAESSGDIDFVLTKKGTSSTEELTPFLARLARDLEDAGILVATLAASRVRSDGSKLHGCCVLPPPGPSTWRRVDFLLVPESEVGAALLYFTGNDIFNRSMRLLASKKGMRLNQRGLYEGVARSPGREKVSEGRLVEGRDERRIFEVLGVKWREPWERWC
ncbi:hypothetical protein VUR80DRAFT_3275 [Thermomyces stellatus]